MKLCDETDRRLRRNQNDFSNGDMVAHSNSPGNQTYPDNLSLRNSFVLFSCSLVDRVMCFPIFNLTLTVARRLCERMCLASRDSANFSSKQLKRHLILGIVALGSDRSGPKDDPEIGSAEELRTGDRGNGLTSGMSSGTFPIHDSDTIEQSHFVFVFFSKCKCIFGFLIGFRSRYTSTLNTS